MQYVGVLAAIAALAFVAFVVVSHGSAIDPVVHERYSTDLARLHTLDHRLSEDLMRARTGRITTYDPLVETFAELRAVHARLAVIPPHVAPAGAQALAAALGRSRETLESEADLLERFKSQNAVLRNSLRFLPVAAADLASRTEDAALVARTDALVRDVLMLDLWSEEHTVARLEEELAALAGMPELPGAEVELLVRHARVVVARRPSVEQLLARMFALQRARSAERIDVVYRTSHATAARVDSRNDAVRFALALAAVVLGAAFIIARMRRSARALEHTSAQLVAAVDMKNRFVSMTSHEFRTPLSVILSSTELLEAYADRWKPEKKREHFERIRGSVQSMTQLIDGILLIGRGEAGVLDFKPAEIDLDRLCTEVIAAVRAKTGGAREIDYQPPERAVIVADERLIRHVLDNLLSNAIKYSPQGGAVSLGARCDGEVLVLRVRDQGLGIPEDDRARLFESFRRGTNVGAIPGTGLGLAVVRRATELHGGTISVESAVGAGTTFEVALPVSQPSAASEPRIQGAISA